MRFVNGYSVCYYQLETEDGVEYRRGGPGVWERGYGESWESEYSKEEELEAAYNNYMFQFRVVEDG